MNEPGAVLLGRFWQAYVDLMLGREAWRPQFLLLWMLPFSYLWALLYVVQVLHYAQDLRRLQRDSLWQRDLHGWGA